MVHYEGYEPASYVGDYVQSHAPQYHQGPNGTLTESFHGSVQMHGAGQRHRASLSSEEETRAESLDQQETFAQSWLTSELGAAGTTFGSPFRTPLQVSTNLRDTREQHSTYRHIKSVSSLNPAPTFERYQDQAQPFDALRYQSLGAVHQQQLQNQGQHHEPPTHGYYVAPYAQNLQRGQADENNCVPNAVLNSADGNDAFTNTTNLDSESWNRNFIAMLQTHSDGVSVGQEYHGRSDPITHLPTKNNVGNFQAPPGLSCGRDPVFGGFNQPNCDPSLFRQGLDQIQSFPTGDLINTELSSPGGARDHFRLDDVAQFADAFPEPQMNNWVQSMAPNPGPISPPSHEVYQSVDSVFCPATTPSTQRSDYHSLPNSSPRQAQEEILLEKDINFGDYSFGEQFANTDSHQDSGVSPSSYQTTLPLPRDDEIVPNAGNIAHDFAPHLASEAVFEVGLEAVAETGAADLVQSPEQLASLPTASASNEIVLEFQTAQDLQDFKESRKSPQNHDPSLPTTWAAKSVHVLRLKKAMIDTSLAEDSRGTSWQKRWAKSPDELYYDHRGIEAACWELIDKAVELHQHGIGILNCYDGDQTRKYAKSQGLSFQERVDKIVELVMKSKDRVNTLMKHDGFDTVVAQPDRLIPTSTANRGFNKTRADHLKRAREVLDGNYTAAATPLSASNDESGGVVQENVDITIAPPDHQKTNLPGDCLRISSAEYAVDDGAFPPLVRAARHTQLAATSPSTQSSPFSTAEPRNGTASTSRPALRMPATHKRVLPRPVVTKTGVSKPLNGNGKRSADALPDRSPSPKHARSDGWHVKNATPTYDTNSAPTTGRRMAPLLPSGRVLANSVSWSNRGRKPSRQTQHLQPGMPAPSSKLHSFHDQHSFSTDPGARHVARTSTPVKRKRSAEADSESLGQVKRVQTRKSHILPPRDPFP